MSMEASSPYAATRLVASLDDCLFYHTMELPGVGVVPGPWDLRPAPAVYLGNVDFRGKRALDVGTASGFLCFEMEREGADVVAYDLDHRSESWDHVPFGGWTAGEKASEWAAQIGRINNAFWFAHEALGSQARVAYGSVYDVPETIGRVDITVFGSILLHLRDPFRALERSLALTTETVVITDVAGLLARTLGRLPPWASHRVASCARLPANLGLLPDPSNSEPIDTWWRIDPWVAARMIRILGFEVASLTFHRQLFKGIPYPLYTLVGRRVSPLKSVESA